MKAIILAAGKGSRLYPISSKIPKGMLEVNNCTIIDRLINQLSESNIHDITIVTGYGSKTYEEKFKEKKNIKLVYYPFYSTTNNLHTLWFIKDLLNDDIILSFSDLIFEKDILNKLISSKSDLAFAVHSLSVLDGTMKVSYNSSKLTSITRTSKENANGNFIGISKFSKLGCKIVIDEMLKIVKSGHNNDYYTIAIDNYIKSGGYVEAINVNQDRWIEIDDINDYNNAVSLFGNN